MAIWFVYRSHYEGPLSRRVRRLRAGSLLQWFQARVTEAHGAKSEDEARRISQDELGGSVYGFGTYFEAARKERLTPPGSASTLKRQLRAHLYVEGDAEECIRIDGEGHSLRVRTDDDEVQLAYYFFDDEAVAASPDRLSWLLHQEPRLPEVPGGSPVAPYAPPEPVKELACASPPPGPSGEGVTYACLLTFSDGDSLCGEAVALPGVRLPGLAAHLRQVTPAAKPQPWGAAWMDTWPLELRLLRAMTAADEAGIAGALARAARYPLLDLRSAGNPSRLGLGGADAARDEFAAAMPARHSGDPERSIVYAGEHAALVCAHLSTFFGYQQWVLFDDIWAAAHRDLATSLLRYTVRWDPFPARAAPRPRGARSQEATQRAAAQAQARAFTQAIAGREGTGRAYQPGACYAAGEVIDHGKFGAGVVQRVEGKYIDVCFKDATRRLIHAPAVAAPPSLSRGGRRTRPG